MTKEEYDRDMADSNVSRTAKECMRHMYGDPYGVHANGSHPGNTFIWALWLSLVSPALAEVALRLMGY